jgi:hypothetical protein
MDRERDESGDDSGSTTVIFLDVIVCVVSMRWARRTRVRGWKVVTVGAGLTTLRFAAAVIA